MKRTLAMAWLLVASAVVSAGQVNAQAIPAAACNETTVPGRVAVCWKKVPKTIKYRPSMPECGGKAAAILSGGFLGSFSVVLRDRGNADRIPACRPSGNYGGCTAAECGDGLSKCSAAKVFRIVKKGSGASRREIHCFREKGTSPILRNVTRLTIKRTSAASSLVRAQLRKAAPGSAALSLN